MLQCEGKNQTKQTTKRTREMEIWQMRYKKKMERKKGSKKKKSKKSER